MSSLHHSMAALKDFLHMADIAHEGHEPTVTLTFPSPGDRARFVATLKMNMRYEQLHETGFEWQSLQDGVLELYGIRMILTTQERKEDGSQPRDPSSPATQRHNPEKVA